MSINIRPIDKSILDEIDIYISKGTKHGDECIMYDRHSVDAYEEYMAKKYFHLAWRSIITLLEANNLSFLVKEAISEYDLLKKDPLDCAMGSDEPYLIWPCKIELYTEAIKTLYITPTKSDNKKDFLLLTGILKNCDIYATGLEIFAWRPCNEADVHDRIESLLKCYFPDLKRKPVLNKPIKNFEPDSGIPSIRTLIEYKYITNKKESKIIFDQIFADINGYQCDEYDNIIFVIYETDRCFYETEWKTALKNLETKMKLELVLLRGTPPTAEDRALQKSHSQKNVKAKSKAIHAIKEKNSKKETPVAE
jgi:hypothetical protein